MVIIQTSMEIHNLGQLFGTLFLGMMSQMQLNVTTHEFNDWYIKQDCNEHLIHNFCIIYFKILFLRFKIFLNLAAVMDLHKFFLVCAPCDPLCISRRKIFSESS